MRLPPATSQPLRRARLGIRGYLVLYAAGLGSMLLGGAVVHAVAQPDLVRCSVCRRVGGGRRVYPPVSSRLVRRVAFSLLPSFLRG